MHQLLKRYVKENNLLNTSVMLVEYPIFLTIFITYYKATNFIVTQFLRHQDQIVHTIIHKTSVNLHVI